MADLDPAQQRIVLAVVSHHVDPAYEIEPGRQVFHYAPAAIAAAIVHQNDFA